MSLRLEHLQVSRLGPPLLEDAAELVRDFVLSTQNDDGGFADREGNSDLYYTVFALDCLCALQHPLPEESVADFLASRHPDELDFVHLCCLARCWSALESHPAEVAASVLKRVETFRAGDGGYHPGAGSGTGTAYGCFLAYGAYSDLGEPPCDPDGFQNCLDALRTPDGGWANDARMTVGSTAATAAAVAVCRNLRHPFHTEKAGRFLIAQAHREGGFVAAPGTPMPDLLSTAVALHALDGLQADFEGLKEPCLDFIDTLWSAEGGFHGNWTDDVLDTEYTFYGLLALGHLSL